MDELFPIDKPKIKKLLLSRGFFPDGQNVVFKRKARANGEGSIRKKGNGWEGRVSVGFDASGKQLRKSVYAKSRKECSQKMQELLAQYHSGSLESCPTLMEWHLTWLNQYRKDLAASTRKRYLGILEKLKKYPIAEMPVNQIRPIDLQSFINDFQSYEMCRRALSMLNETLRLAMDNGYTTKNLAANLRNPLKSPKPKHEESEKAFTIAEEQKFVDAICDNPYRLLYLISLYAGLRRGEVCALTWNNIDMTQRTICVNTAATRSESHGYKTGDPKTISGVRRVPISDTLYATLAPYTQDGGYVCQKNGAMLNPDILTMDFGIIMKQLAMTHTLHQLRHTFATRCMEKGISIKVVQAWMGHAKADVTMNTYTHATADTFAAELAKLNG